MPDRQVVPDAQWSADADPVLAAVDVTKHFPVHGKDAGRLGTRRVVHALDGASIGVYQSRVTALVGESGSGKSTLARVLAGLYPRTSGAVLLRGRTVTATRGRALRRHVGQVQLILQDPYGSFNPMLRVSTHLERAVRIHEPQCKGESLRARTRELLEQVHLRPAGQFLGKYPHELSGGQLQRVSIARALAARPAVLLADEPVSNLDVSIRLGVLNLLAELTRDGTGLLYVTHDVASARYFATDTAVMYAGQVIESGPSEQVTGEPAHPYTRLLISSAPDPARPAGGERAADRGQPPSLISPPAGCRFHPRCPFAMPQCRREAPPRFEVGDGHWTRCWLFAQGRDTPHSPRREPS
ncbi:MAG TPA: ABC transporter ATP-binding protein [Trebonia sp.]|jgi:peptide/nickel transport system ATP-binding protein|nr:ABC transporter ATP-binding protein [Trebonia sp.]